MTLSSTKTSPARVIILASATLFLPLVGATQDPAALDPGFNADDSGNAAAFWYERAYQHLVALPDGLTFQSGPAAYDGATGTWSGGPIGAGSSGSFTITALVTGCPR